MEAQIESFPLPFAFSYPWVLTSPPPLAPHSPWILPSSSALPTSSTCGSLRIFTLSTLCPFCLPRFSLLPSWGGGRAVLPAADTPAPELGLQGVLEGWARGTGCAGGGAGPSSAQKSCSRGRWRAMGTVASPRTQEHPGGHWEFFPEH